MWGNNIGDEGALTIAGALIANTTLEEIDLSSNKIGIIGANAIINAMKVNKCITLFCICTNR